MIFNSFMTGALLYRNQSIDLQKKSMDWFLYDNGLSHERVKSRQFRFSKLPFRNLKDNNRKYLTIFV